MTTDISSRQGGKTKAAKYYREQFMNLFPDEYRLPSKAERDRFIERYGDDGIMELDWFWQCPGCQASVLALLDECPQCASNTKEKA